MIGLVLHALGLLWIVSALSVLVWMFVFSLAELYRAHQAKWERDRARWRAVREDREVAMLESWLET